MLKQYINEKRKQKDILLMTHIVLGYPSIEVSMQLIDIMVQAGVDLMELQIPFSEPMADGPIILKANQSALESGVTVAGCMEEVLKITKKHAIPFLYMSYFNILFKYGLEPFIKRMKTDHIKGAIVPDLPPEEGAEYIHLMKENSRSPIFIYSPNTSKKRMRLLSAAGDGFIYCVARKGVTGKQTQFSSDIDQYLKQCRESTDLPLAVGFGVKEKPDVDFLKGKTDIAVIGSESIRIVNEKGVNAVGDFISDLLS
jgi:tryptophan synthase alpha chain